MKLSDVVSNSGLSIYAEIAMIVFMVAFVAIVIRLFWPSRRDALERKRHLPLDDGLPAASDTELADHAPSRGTR